MSSIATTFASGTDLKNVSVQVNGEKSYIWLFLGISVRRDGVTAASVSLSRG